MDFEALDQRGQLVDAGEPGPPAPALAIMQAEPSLTTLPSAPSDIRLVSGPPSLVKTVISIPAGSLLMPRPRRGARRRRLLAASLRAESPSRFGTGGWVSASVPPDVDQPGERLLGVARPLGDDAGAEHAIEVDPFGAGPLRPEIGVVEGSA